MSKQSHLKSEGAQPVRFGTPEMGRLIDDIGESVSVSTRAGLNPYVAMALVRESRLGALRVPLAEGGGGSSLREFFATLMDLAEAAPDIPHILRAHYWFVEDRLRSTNLTERAYWLERVVAGDIFGNAVTELGGSAAVGTWIMQTHLTPTDGGFVLDGKKYYVTGSLYSDWVSVQASTPEGTTAVVVIPTDRAGV